MKKGDLDPHFAKVARAFAKDPKVTVGGRFGSSSLARDGTVFVMLTRGNFVAKLPADRVQALVLTGTAEPFRMGKRTMKEWVALSGSPQDWLPLAKEAYRFVG